MTGVQTCALPIYRLILDPSREEEDASEARLTIGISDGVISSMQKGEITPLKDEEILKAIDMADKAWKELFKKIEELSK